jgi:hypothetical protein
LGNGIGAQRVDFIAVPTTVERAAEFYERADGTTP